MQLKPRLLAAAFGLAFAPLAAFAQDIPLLTESSVIFDITFSTTITTKKGAGTTRVDSTKAYKSTILYQDVVKGFIADGTIPNETDDTGKGWRFVAVRSAPADLSEVHTQFYLYAVKEENGTIVRRVPIPSTRFFISANSSARNAVTTHSTRNIISSAGKVTNHADLFFTPNFVRKEVPAVIIGNGTDENGRYNLSEKIETRFDLDDLLSGGFSTINFVSVKDPVFFFGISGMTYVSKGDFSGELRNVTTVTRIYTTRGKEPKPDRPDVVDPVTTPASGLVAIRVTLYPAKLVEASLYPDVAF